MSKRAYFFLFCSFFIVVACYVAYLFLGSSSVPMSVVQDVGSVQGERVEYANGIYGYYAHPGDEGQYPGIVMIHEWWGLNDHIQNMAYDLASEGYNVLAVDLYGGRVAETTDEARELVGGVNPQESLANLRSAVSFLRHEQSSKIASLGWCFGGGQSMQLSLSGESLDASIIYYGSLETDEESLSRIEWPVLGIFGADDQSIPVEEVTSFQTSLDNLSIDNEVYVYDGVGHAFANPSGANFSSEEAQDAWHKTLQFLQRTLKSIDSFSACMEAGNPIMESYPRKCSANGVTYTENIGNVLEKADLIQLDYPYPSAQISSPLEVRGSARGVWFFEGDFPLLLTDWDGRIIAEGYAEAQGEWMTEDFIPFVGSLEFETPGVYPRGSLILRKDNPSGLPENDDALEIPIVF